MKKEKVIQAIKRQHPFSSIRIINHQLIDIDSKYATIIYKIEKNGFLIVEDMLVVEL